MEEALQNELKGEAVHTANQKLYESQDRVKAFHSKMLMCDVLAERDQQVKLKKRKQKMMKVVDNQWIDYEKQQVADADEKARVGLEKEYKKKMDNASEVQVQLNDYKLTYLRRMQEDMLEGELLKREVDDMLDKERKKEDKRVQDNKKLMED